MTTITSDLEKALYWMGKRDAIAEVLAMYKDKIKLPELATDYVTTAGEEHFSHKWHTS